MKLLISAGTRPEIIKLFPIMKELNRRGIDYVFVWTGQHYDKNLFEIFLKEFDLKKPDYDLKIGSGSHASQTYKVIKRLNPILKREKPDMVIVQGDTNSCLASALTSIKMKIPVAHVEAGLRSFDMRMPEEINRRIVDHISQILFAPTMNAAMNLIFEGIESRRIFITGNTIVDAVKYFEKILNNIEHDYTDYILLTIHREENTTKNRLKLIFETLLEIDDRIIFPIHPRTKNALIKIGLYEKVKRKFIVIEPVGYIEFLKLLKNCKLVITDSGGVQEEALTLKKPCVTIRENTERIESILLGFNILTGYDRNRIIRAINRAKKMKIEYDRNPYGDGNAAVRIVDIILKNEFDIQHINFLEKNFIRCVKVINEEISVDKFEALNRCSINKVIRNGKVLLPKYLDVLKKGDIVEYL